MNLNYDCLIGVCFTQHEHNKATGISRWESFLCSVMRNSKLAYLKSWFFFYVLSWETRNLLYIKSWIFLLFCPEKLETCLYKILKFSMFCQEKNKGPWLLTSTSIKVWSRCYCNSIITTSIPCLATIFYNIILKFLSVNSTGVTYKHSHKQTVFLHVIFIMKCIMN